MWWRVLVFLTIVNLTRLVGMMIYELVTVFMVWWLMIDSNTFERGGANSYIGWFSLTLRFALISNFDLSIITLLTSLIGFSKLPVYGLHQWLPKVHVEASLVGSMILAGLILKIRIVFVGLYGYSITLMMVGLMCGVLMMFGSDGKVVMAYSSVIHITLCRVLIRWMGIVVGSSHVVISPLIFVAVYVRYINSGSRLLSSSFRRWTLGVILTINLGFPLVGRFIAEIYMVIMVQGMLFIIFICQYTVMGIVHISLFFKIKRSIKVETKGWIAVLLLLY